MDTPSLELRMYVVVRSDIELPFGKLAPQAGHAFTNALEDARRRTPERHAAYMGTGNPQRLTTGQAKIALRGKLADIEALLPEIAAAGIPHCLVQDEGRTVFPEPTITCLAFGPILADERPKRAKRLQLL
jgi:peptidyl-tRNA hydrolase